VSTHLRTHEKNGNSQHVQAAFWMSFHGQMRLSDFITYCIKEEVLESTILTIFYISIQGDSQRKQI
jgi:hypothetical protein